MAVRRFVIVAVAAGAVAGPATLGTAQPTPSAAPPVEVQGVSRTVVKTSAESDAIDLEVERNGSLAMTLTWSGGSAPYDVMINPTADGEAGRYESGVDDTTLTVATEPGQGYCFEVYGSDGSESSRVCESATRS